MGIIKNLQIKLIEMEKINIILSDKLKALELTVANLSKIVPNIKQNSISPILPTNLDSNNIWIGDKGESSYTNLALLDIYYDSVDEKWRPFECEAGAIPTEDADYIVTMMWSSVDKKFIVYKNPGYAIYYPD